MVTKISANHCWLTGRLGRVGVASENRHGLRVLPAGSAMIGQGESDSQSAHRTWELPQLRQAYGEPQRTGKNCANHSKKGDTGCIDCISGQSIFKKRQTHCPCSFCLGTLQYYFSGISVFTCPAVVSV